MADKTLSHSKFSTKQITIVGMLFAIIIVLGATGIGFIPIPPMKLTIMHIPVIIGALLEGPIVGGLLGLLFGIFSIFQAINTPTPVSFIFMNPIVAVLPRILIGITPFISYKYIKMKNTKIRISIAAAIGSFTNTIGVLGLIYLLYINQYANALHISLSVANKTLLILLLNGFTSATAAILITLPVVIAVNKSRK